MLILTEINTVILYQARKHYWCLISGFIYLAYVTVWKCAKSSVMG